jgi:hypothetical protein
MRARFVVERNVASSVSPQSVHRAPPSRCLACQVSRTRLARAPALSFAR